MFVRMGDLRTKERERLLIKSEPSGWLKHFPLIWGTLYGSFAVIVIILMIIQG